MVNSETSRLPIHSDILRLQQYLVPFEGGKLQCLPIAWDTEKKRWFHLGDTVYKGQDIKPDNWLYWTNQAQNWNGMCADCHSTNLRKNYDPATNTFNTTWSEIDVSCEAVTDRHLITLNGLSFLKDQDLQM